MKILYVEDEFPHVELTRRTLEDNLKESFVLYHCDSLQSAVDLLNHENGIDIVLTDYRLPDGLGMDLLKIIQEMPKPPAVVLVTGQGDEQVAVAALKAGAADYLVKQSDYLHRLPVVITNAVAQNKYKFEQTAKQEAEVKYQSLVEQIPAVVFLDAIDNDEKTLYISPRILELTGYTPEEWLADKSIWQESIHPEDRDRIAQTEETVQDKFQEEYRFIRRDGRTIWIKEDTNLIRDKNGTPLYWQGILLDITNEVEAKSVLLASEERFRRIFHSTPIPTCVVTLSEGRFIDANLAFQNLTGKELHELVGRTSNELGFWKNPGDRESFLHNLKQAGFLRDIDIEFGNVPNGPRETLAYYEIIELEGTSCILAMFYDVTEQKKTQNALIAERDFALQIMNNMGQGLTVLDKNGSFEYVNPAYATMIGFRVEEIVGKKPSDFSSETQKITLLDERKKRKLGVTSTYEIILVNKNGMDVPAIVTGVPRIQDNEVTGTISVITDLTLQKQSERALDRQVKELRVLHGATLTGTEGASENEIITNMIGFLSQIYNEVCGVLLLDETGQLLVPHSSYIGANVSDWQTGTPLTQGITGQSIREGRHIRTGNIREHPNYIEIASDILSELCVPIRVNKHNIGVINVESRKENAFNEEDERFLMTAAGTLGAALERLRLYAETQQSLREMGTINRVSSSMRTTHGQDEMCTTLLDEALSVLETDSGAVWIYDPVENCLIQRTSRGAASLVKNKKMERTKGIVGHAFSTAEVYISKELITDPRVNEENRKSFSPGVGAAIIPIHSTAGTLGVLSVQIDTNRLSPEKISLLTTLSEIAGNAIHRADLYDQSQEQIRKLTTLRDIDSAINSSTDLRVTLNLLTDHALRHLNVDAVDILLYHPELQSLAYFCSAGFLSPSPSRPLTRIGEGLGGQVVTRGEVVHIPDLKSSNEPTDPFLERENFVAYVGIPVIVKGHVKGVFEIFNRSAFTISDEWMAFLMTLAGQAAIAIDNTQLFDNLQKSNDELKRAYDTTLEGWARALELRDRETEGHTRRVTNLTMELAQYMGIFGDELENIYRGVLLHDIGKMGVPDHILRKTGPLNDDEWVDMRKHPQYAFDLLSPIQYLRPALDIPYCHHEHWDGSGYPRGIKGENIPIAARIFSVVDIWDALLSNRPYRDAWPQEKVVEYLTEISGKVLEPKIVETFLKMLREKQK